MSPRLAVIAALFILVCAAAGGGASTLQAKLVTVPWDCAAEPVWALIDHEERNIAILETLGVNRGKTLYCGIDQSDTLTKAETWEAGRDHNQRDGTEYWGDHGNFFGFTAPQAGWLTDGEHGITGHSIQTIFEFPRVRQRRDRDRGRRLPLEYGRTYDQGQAVNDPDDPLNNQKKYLTGTTVTRVMTSGSTYGSTWVWTEWGPDGDIQTGGTATAAQASARQKFLDANLEAPEYIKERARAGNTLANGGITTTDVSNSGERGNIFIGADAECQQLGYRKAINIDAWLETGWNTSAGERTPPGYDDNQGQNPRREVRKRIFYEATCWSP